MNNLIKISTIILVTTSLSACVTTNKQPSKAFKRFDAQIEHRLKTFTPAEKKRECAITKIMDKDISQKSITEIKSYNKKYNIKISNNILKKNWRTNILAKPTNKYGKKHESQRMLYLMNLHNATKFNCKWTKSAEIK
ncbi:MAG: hypothetical protein HRU28_18650 [Rhizobiales bacterium]|nr:hypothetical protein [Hyphomicrobiales bacterium]